jgi:hypothetical protein
VKITVSDTLSHIFWTKFNDVSEVLTASIIRAIHPLRIEFLGRIPLRILRLK